MTNLSGESVGRLPYERMDVGVLDDTPEVRHLFHLRVLLTVGKMLHNIPQPEFERFLTQELSHDANVDIRKGVSFVSLDQV